MLASYYYVNRQFDKAEEQYKAIANLDPNKPESQVVLADFYAATNRMDDAVRIYQDILSKSPDYMQGRYRLGEILLSKGDTQGASAQIEEALKKDQHDRQALLLRARLRAQGGQADGLKSAIADLNDVLRQEPNSRPALYFLAQYNFSLGQIDQSRAFAAELEKNYPEYLPAKLMQLQLTLTGGDQKAAITQATELLARLDKAAPDRDNSAQLLREIREKTYLSRGTAQLQLRNNAAAREKISKLLATSIQTIRSSTTVWRWFHSPKTNRQMRSARSKQRLKLTALTSTRSMVCSRFTPEHRRWTKPTRESIKHWQSYPNNASLHYLKAQAFGFQHNAQSAEAELKKSLELDSNYLPAYSALGALFTSIQSRKIVPLPSIRRSLLCVLKTLRPTR